jgi:hypothetical protein
MAVFSQEIGSGDCLTRLFLKKSGDPRLEDCPADNTCTGKKCVAIQANQTGFHGPADPNTQFLADTINDFLSGTNPVDTDPYT